VKHKAERVCMFVTICTMGSYTTDGWEEYSRLTYQTMDRYICLTELL